MLVLTGDPVADRIDSVVVAALTRIHCGARLQPARIVEACTVLRDAVGC